MYACDFELLENDDQASRESHSLSNTLNKANTEQSDKRNNAVFHFNRVVAKRSVFYCVHIISSA